MRIIRLRRFLSPYPGGLAGIGLVILRLAAGCAVIAKGVFWLMTLGVPVENRALGTIGVLSGILLLLGLRTRAAAFLALAFIAVAWFLRRPEKMYSLDWPPPAILVAAISGAILFLGPGSVSVDARVFGRREIEIPLRPKSDDDQSGLQGDE